MKNSYEKEIIIYKIIRLSYKNYQIWKIEITGKKEARIYNTFFIIMFVFCPLLF